MEDAPPPRRHPTWPMGMDSFRITERETLPALLKQFCQPGSGSEQGVPHNGMNH